MNNDFMNRVNAIRSGNQPQPQPQNQYGAFAEMVPRRAQLMNEPHMLAYINPQEEQMLRDMGGAGIPGPDGIPVYGFFDWAKDTFKEVTSLGKAETKTYNPTTYTPTVTTTPTTYTPTVTTTPTVTNTNTNNNTTPVVTNTTPVVTNTTPVVTNTTPTTTNQNNLYENLANLFTPGDGKTYRDGELVDESVGQYTSVDGGTTSNIRPLARSHTVDVDGSPLDFGAAGSDGVTRYVEDLERGQLTPSIYTPGYGDEDFDIGLGETALGYAKSALGSLIPGSGFMSVAKLLGKLQVNPSASDKVISKVDGQTIYQNADGDYYTEGGADNLYFTKGAYDPTPVSDNSENAGTVVSDSNSLGALPGAAGAGGGGAGDQSSSILEYQRRRKGGGYGMLPEYMKKYITGEKIDETVRTVVLEDGTEVFVTMDGRMLSQDDLKNTALAGDIIRYNTAGDRVDIDGNIINSDGDRIDSDGNVMDAGIMAPQQIVEQSQERKDFIV
jgi:RNase P/RNase MRP subunit p29